MHYRYTTVVKVTSDILFILMIFPLGSILGPACEFAICIFPSAVCPWVRSSVITGGRGRGTLCPFESAALKGTHDFVDQTAPFSTFRRFQALTTWY